MSEQMDLAPRTGASMNRWRSEQDVGTPPDFLDAVEKRFGVIRHDLGASEKYHVADTYFTEHQDAFTQDWAALRGWLWLNPPFGDIGPWAEKCRDESRRGARILLLTPASSDTHWFHEFLAPHAYVLDLRPRIKFIGHTSSFPKPLVLSVFAYGFKGRDQWRWKP